MKAELINKLRISNTLMYSTKPMFEKLISIPLYLPSHCFYSRLIQKPSDQNDHKLNGNILTG